MLFSRVLAGNLCDCSSTFTSSTFRHTGREEEEEEDIIDKPDRRKEFYPEAGRAGGNLEKDRSRLAIEILNH